MNQQNLIKDASTALREACLNLTVKHNLAFATPEFVLFEFLAISLRKKAPLEFDEYLRAFTQELSKEDVDLGAIQEVRRQLRDTLELISFS